MPTCPIRRQCLTYVPVLHDGVGWVQICVSILENFPADLLAPTIVLPRAFRPISPPVQVKQAIPYPIPYRYAVRVARPAVNFFFKRTIEKADTRNAVAYFWPSPPPALVSYARKLGLVTVREMINTFTGTAKVILDEAYARLGLKYENPITDQTVEREQKELELYDFILSPNPRIEKSLIEIGIAPRKILRSSYGWTPSSFASSAGETNRRGFRALFIGGIGVRKGVPQLLAAWKKCGVVGELLLVGSVEPAIRPLLNSYLEGQGVRVAGFSFGLGPFYKSADIFVLPSLEEGDPLVTYEAAGCGLPVVATPMGSANIIKDGVNGLIVEPHDVDGLAHAISSLANSPELRSRLARQAATDALNYTTERIGHERAKLLSGLLTKGVENYENR
jgi:glycosyltransferase involved in cell wall biosynthesis